MYKCARVRLCRGWRDVQRYLAEGLPHLITRHGAEFDSGAALLSAAVAAAPIAQVPAFVAARTDGGENGGGPCVSPQAVEALLNEQSALPLSKASWFPTISATFQLHSPIKRSFPIAVRTSAPRRWTLFSTSRARCRSARCPLSVELTHLSRTPFRGCSKLTRSQCAQSLLP